jgi:predicted dehydrogenase
MSSKIFNWGIIGAGGIASVFTNDLKFTSDQKVIAVGSRDQSRAAEFAEKHHLDRAYSSYEALLADPDIDAVYIATHHPSHCQTTLLALRAGKPVLCEKPFAMSAAQTRTMIETAKEENLMLMEAMWTRFLPHMHQIRKVVASGVLGEITTVMADHGQYLPATTHNRLHAPELGGSAWRDLGIYPVSFAHMVLGKPSRIVAVADPTQSGVDAQTSAIFQYESGAQALLTCTLRSLTPCTASITGTEGRIEIAGTFYRPTSFRILLRDADPVDFSEPYEGIGHREQAVEFARCVRSGLLESPILPLAETFSIMESMDEVIRQTNYLSAG